MCGSNGKNMLNLTIEGGLATVELNRPPANAVNAEWLDAFEQMMETVRDLPDVAVIHLRSTQKLFCAGADLHLMRESLKSSSGVDAMMSVVTRMQRAFVALSRLPQVTLAEIGGAALGGGFELALACDLRMASETAIVGLPEAKLGLLPGAGGTQRITHLVGPGLAARLILGAETINGAEAYGLGLVQWTFSPQNLGYEARKIALRLAEMPPMALAACKSCIAAASPGMAEGMQLELSSTRVLYESEQTQVLVRSFVEGRASQLNKTKGTAPL